MRDAGRCRAAGWSALRASEPAVIVCRTLGPIEVTVDGAPAPAELLWRKHLALLVYLARSPRQTRSREHLIGLLWADRTELAARHSLSEALRVIRRHVGPRGRGSHGRPCRAHRGRGGSGREPAGGAGGPGGLDGGRRAGGGRVPRGLRRARRHRIRGLAGRRAGAMAAPRRRGPGALCRCAGPRGQDERGLRGRGSGRSARADLGGGVSGGAPEPLARGRPRRRARAVRALLRAPGRARAHARARTPGR